jgi:hypothetical protein
MMEDVMKRILAISLSVAALIAIGAEARAQSPAAIEAMCATHARQSWPDDYIYNSTQRARQQVYINCMSVHGLRP